MLAAGSLLLLIGSDKKHNDGKLTEAAKGFGRDIPGMVVSGLEEVGGDKVARPYREVLESDKSAGAKTGAIIDVAAGQIDVALNGERKETNAQKPIKSPTVETPSRALLPESATPASTPELQRAQ